MSTKTRKFAWKDRKGALSMVYHLLKEERKIVAAMQAEGQKVTLGEPETIKNLCYRVMGLGGSFVNFYCVGGVDEYGDAIIPAGAIEKFRRDAVDHVKARDQTVAMLREFGHNVD